AQHYVHLLRRYRQVGVDGAGEGMDQLRPARVPQPQCGAAPAAEPPLRGALLAVDPRVKHADVALAGDFHRVRLGAEIDGIPTAPRRLPADGAVAAQIRYRRVS